MITILGKTKEIEFTPRAGFRRKATAQALPLVYGTTCPYCSNVIMALFHTATEVDLWPYEQTNVLTESKKEERQGEIIKVFPTDKEPEGASCYRSDFFAAGNEHGQLITLKNHLMRYEAMREREPDSPSIFEVGERTCPYTGVWAWTEDLLLRDLSMLFMLGPQMLEAYDLPSLQTLFPPVGENPSAKYHRLAVLGDVPEVILMERETVQRGLPYWLKEQHFKPYRRPQASQTS